LPPLGVLACHSLGRAYTPPSLLRVHGVKSAGCVAGGAGSTRVPGGAGLVACIPLTVVEEVVVYGNGLRLATTVGGLCATVWAGPLCSLLTADGAVKAWGVEKFMGPRQEREFLKGCRLHMTGTEEQHTGLLGLDLLHACPSQWWQ
jgi:hypothetical protein